MRKILCMFVVMLCVLSVAYAAGPGGKDGDPGSDEVMDIQTSGSGGSAGAPETVDAMGSGQGAAKDTGQGGAAMGNEMGSGSDAGTLQQPMLVSNEERERIREEGSGQMDGKGAGEKPVPSLYRDDGGAKEELRARDTNELRSMIHEKALELNQSMKGKSEKEQKVLKNQNQVRIAVHALLAMENLTGGIGPQVREIARNFNNSVQATIRAEEKIESRSGIARFFAGGDAAAAEEIDGLVTQNKERIQELKKLKDGCADCDAETKEAMQEQIAGLETEQERLGELAKKEKASKGLIGWLWK